MQISDPNSTKNFIAGICEKFTETFEKLRDLKSTLESLKVENQYLKEQLDEEKENTKKTKEKTIENILNLETKKNELTLKFDEELILILKLKEELSSMSSKLDDEMKKIGFQVDSTKNKSLISEKTKQIYLISTELKLLKNEIEEITLINTKTKQQIDFIKSQNDLLIEENSQKEQLNNEKNSILSELESLNAENLASISDIMASLRKNLKENREKQLIISQKEKQLDSLSEELESKIDRLNTIIASNRQLKTKLFKNEDLYQKYRQISDQNSFFSEEISVLRRKISITPDLYGHKIEIPQNNTSKNFQNVKMADLTEQNQLKITLTDKYERLQRFYSERLKEREELKSENALLYERDSDLEKEILEETEKNTQMSLSYNKMVETLELFKSKINNII